MDCDIIADPKCGSASVPSNICNEHILLNLYKSITPPPKNITKNQPYLPPCSIRARSTNKLDSSTWNKTLSLGQLDAFNWFKIVYKSRCKMLKKFCDNFRWKSVHQNPILHETWSLSCIVRNLNFTACEANLYFKTSKDNLRPIPKWLLLSERKKEWTKSSKLCQDLEHCPHWW